MPAFYTVEEVKPHNKTSDCWIIYKGKVYDVTPFLEDHPGGQEIVLEHAGTDATVAFDDIGHSSSAYEMLKDFYIGDVVESKAGKGAESKQTDSKAESIDKSIPKPKPQHQSNLNWPLIGGVIIIGAAIAYNAFSRK